MKIFKPVVALVTLLPMAANAQTGDQNKIEAGVRIGRVYLGDSKSTVHRRLGKPTASFVSASGVTSELWKGSRNPKNGTAYRLEVVYKRGIVTQIETTNPRFQLANGLNVGSEESVWWDTYGDPSQRVLNYPKRKVEYRYDDWKAQGIAVEQYYQPQRYGSVVSYPETLIVHRKGVAVIPDFGGVPSALR